MKFVQVYDPTTGYGTGVLIDQGRAVQIISTTGQTDINHESVQYNAILVDAANLALEAGLIGFPAVLQG